MRRVTKKGQQVEGFSLEWRENGFDRERAAELCIELGGAWSERLQCYGNGLVDELTALTKNQLMDLVELCDAARRHHARSEQRVYEDFIFHRDKAARLAVKVEALQAEVDYTTKRWVVASEDNRVNEEFRKAIAAVANLEVRGKAPHSQEEIAAAAEKMLDAQEAARKLAGEEA